MKSNFLTYIQDTFQFSLEEIQDFETSLTKTLKRSFHINTRKISVEDFVKKVEKKWWKISPTGYGKNTFYLDSLPETYSALWNTIEHINGYFYIQEVAAGSSAYYLSDDTIDTWEYRILDMSASPGGKTSQLSCYYPNASIIANELDKNRLRTLQDTINRISATNIAVTNYDGRNFKNFPEIFDKILLDAPCSGEGTAFKTDDALKFWNLKNIEQIAQLQFQLFESALFSLKIWWEIVYSTCTLNKIENEWVIGKITEKYPWVLEALPLMNNNGNNTKRNWSHKDQTGWFFVAKFRKISSISWTSKENIVVKQNIGRLQSKQDKYIRFWLESSFWFETKSYNIYEYRWKIFLADKKLHILTDSFFFFQIGMEIGEFRGQVFEPNFFLGSKTLFSKNTLNMSEEETLKLLLWEKQESNRKNWFYQLSLDNWILWWIVKVQNNKIRKVD